MKTGSTAVQQRRHVALGCSVLGMERREMSPSPTAEGLRGPRRAASQLIIRHLTVYQSQRISSRPRELWIFRLYGLINFAGIIRPPAQISVLTNAAPHNVPPPSNPRLNASHDKQGGGPIALTKCLGRRRGGGCSSLHYRREGSYAGDTCALTSFSV